MRTRAGRMRLMASSTAERTLAGISWLAAGAAVRKHKAATKAATNVLLVRMLIPIKHVLEQLGREASLDWGTVAKVNLGPTLSRTLSRTFATGSSQATLQDKVHLPLASRPGRHPQPKFLGSAGKSQQSVLVGHTGVRVVR